MHQQATIRFVIGTAIASIAAAALVARVSPSLSWESAQAAGFFALIGLAAQALGHRMPKGVTGYIGFIPFLSGLAVAPGLPLVLAVGLAVFAAEILQRRTLVKAVFNVCQHVLAISLAVLTYVGLGGKPLTQLSALGVAPFAVAFGAFLAANTLTVSGVVAISQKRRLIDVWRQITQGTVLYDFLAMPVVLLFAWVYANKGALLASGIAIPLIGLRQLYKTNRQLETINEEMLQLMVAAIEARDPYTSGHSQRVAEYSRIVARAAGLGSRATERVYTAALLHDVGKIHEEFAPILRKPGRLTDAEFEIMKTHSEKGAVLVAKVTQFRDLVATVRGHHEAWDGSGYPDGIGGEKIPRWARVIAFADTMDAMTTDRPYRAALGPGSVRIELENEAGHQFDPAIAAQLISNKHWPLMADALRRNSATRKPTPLFIEAVPRHSAARKSLSFSK